MQRARAASSPVDEDEAAAADSSVPSLSARGVAGKGSGKMPKVQAGRQTMLHCLAEKLVGG